MNRLLMALLASAALVSAVESSFAQSVEIGPGGVRIYDGRRGPPPPPPPPPYGGPGYGPRGELCANEGGFCDFRGFANVRYGARGRYVVRPARDGIPCNNRVFGDPTPGIPKRCFIE